ncbi:uncharacterized protein N7515_007619 [Penicillium bovifimosum]|uniref:Uncharacterized protein n=1 Tax=Penicillium bovifimosum TaxID=126998 RepID=A0A9W9GWZ2_9EURO|nr:uncharacterized protein N7515_007619 [Penicillium bovifimosum]KAJ5131580.1 hypothetical protein N7515_007619 [Penicillium bovifimosum]
MGLSTTKSDSTHNLEFKATLVHWNTFDKEVRALSHRIDWKNFPSVLAYAPTEKHAGPHHTYSEHWLCGDELSVSGRFGQNVGHITSSVFRALNIPSWFGDYRTCVNGTVERKVPDFVMVNAQGHLQAVGEMKTPWMHNLKNVMLSDQTEFRHCLGQISRYMYLSKMKYGFLTTYDQTIFFKQAPSPGKAKELALWHSDVVYYHQGGNMVSLRECFLFLGLHIKAGDYTCENTMPYKRWVGSPGGVYTDDDYLSPDDSRELSDRHSSESPPPVSARTTAARHGMNIDQRARRVVTRSQSQARHVQDLEGPHLQSRLRRARDSQRRGRDATERGGNEITEGTQALRLERESRPNVPPTPAYLDQSGRPYVRMSDQSRYVTLVKDGRGQHYYETTAGRQYVEVQ